MTKTPPPAPITDAEFLEHQAIRYAKRGEHKHKKRLRKIAKKLRDFERESKE